MENLIPNCSCPVQFYWISLFCSQYFALDYLRKQFFGIKLGQSSSILKRNIKHVSHVKIPNLRVLYKKYFACTV